jgi:hypothetical protein
MGVDAVALLLLLWLYKAGGRGCCSLTLSGVMMVFWTRGDIVVLFLERLRSSRFFSFRRFIPSECSAGENKISS